jgi:hypothetical protein
MKIRLKDKKGNVIEVDNDGLKQNKKGEYFVCLNKYSYFCGVETDENPTTLHYRLLQGKF